MNVEKEYLDRYFWPKVRKTSECWEWQAANNGLGYGQLNFRGKRWSAHRLSYEAHYGPIPPGRVVRHRCDNRACVRPDHLEVGTHADNSRDMIQRGRSSRHRADRTHCPSGHAFDEVNTYWWNGCRQCRACKDAHQARKRVTSGAAERSNRLTGQDRADLTAIATSRYAAGETLKEIADSCGRSRELIRALLIEAGVTIRSKQYRRHRDED